MTYFVIRNSDGDTTVDELSKEEILEAITESHYGGEPMNVIPEDDTNYWGFGFLIIKGEIVVPKPKEVVTEFEIE